MRQSLNDTLSNNPRFQSDGHTESGREPGRSRADRLTLSARRGRFSPFEHYRKEGRSTARRRLTHGLPVVIVAGFAGILGLVDFGFPTYTSGAPNENVERKQTADRIGSAGAPTNEASALSNPQEPDIRPKPNTPPPPKSDRPLEYKTKRVRPKEKPRNEAQPVKKKRPVSPPPKKKKKKAQPANDRPSVVVRTGGTIPRGVPPIGIPPLPPPPPVEVVQYVDYYDTEQEEVSLEAYSVVLTAASLVVNGVYIQAGERNEIAAVTGLLFGAISLAVGSGNDARVPLLDYFLGAAAIGLSVWNLAGGIQRVDVSEQELEPYLASSTYSLSTPPSLSYSFSF